MKKWECNGSVTVEASIYIPLVMFLYLFVMHTGMDLYRETGNLAIQIQQEEQVDVKKLFYLKENLGELFENGD